MADTHVISVSNTIPTPADLTKSVRKKKLKRVSNEQKMEKRMKSIPRYQGSSKKLADDKKAKRLIRKRTREYNSDEEEEGDAKKTKSESNKKHGGFVEEEFQADDDDDDDDDFEEESDEGEDGIERTKEVTKFVEGCRAFKTAFQKIMKKNQPSDALGPVLSAHKKLLIEKLAEEVEELKGKREVKKERHLVGEKGHVLPANFLNSKDKFLSSIATKGVVKLFNAVNKAQHAQKGLNPNKAKDAKTLAKRKKDAFLSELRKPTTNTNDGLFKSSKNDEKNKDEPAWDPLKDSYMLTNPKLKDWDKKDSSLAYESYKTPLESSDEEEEE